MTIPAYLFNLEFIIMIRTIFDREVINLSSITAQYA